jgi:hypothetical protein
MSKLLIFLFIGKIISINSGPRHSQLYSEIMKLDAIIFLFILIDNLLYGSGNLIRIFSSSDTIFEE